MDKGSSTDYVEYTVEEPLLELGELHANREQIKEYIRSKQLTRPITQSEEEEPKAGKSKARPVVRKEEKNKFGEVFTPNMLIKDMLDKLPKELWGDPTKKWLDPATGFANFPIMVYEGLMEGLAEHPDFTDSAVRSEHIIKRMLYMVEYNKDSCKIIREIFGTAANLFCGSFLEPIIFPDRTTQFDVIVGNPPFNADQTHEGKKGGGSNLWPEFVNKSLDILSPGGYLLFVHPALWRKPPSDRARTLFDKMVHDNHMLYLEIHSKPDGFRDFGVQTRYDYYVIQKRQPIPSKDFTVVKDQIGQEHPSIDLSRWRFLPNHSFELIEPLLSDKKEDYVIFSRGQYGSDKDWVISDEKKRENIEKDSEYHEFKFPLVHSTTLNGPKIYWSKRMNDDCKDCKKMFGVPKLIFGESGINTVIIDDKGENGVTQGAMAIKISGRGEGEIMKRVIESVEFHRILDAMSFSNFRIDWRMFLYFRPNFYTDPQFATMTPFVRPSVLKKRVAGEQDRIMDFVQTKIARNEPSKTAKSKTTKSKTTKSKTTKSKTTPSRTTPLRTTPSKTQSPFSEGGRKRKCRNCTKRRKRNLRYTRKKY
jgi:hypothetical protein